MNQYSKELEQALRIVGEPDAEPRDRLAACNTLIKSGHVNPALDCLGELRAHPQLAGSARLLQRTGEYLLRRGLARDPGSPGRGDAWIEDGDHFAAWRSPDPAQAARNLLIVFTGVTRQFWLSLDILHRIVQHHAGQVLYLRDFESLSYLGGITGWGGYQETIERLREHVRSAGAARLCIMGISAGGFGALRYGLDLGADAVVALSPATELQWMLSKEPESGKLKAFGILSDALDLVPIYAAAPRRPPTFIIFGAQNGQDRAQALRMQHIEGVKLLPIPRFAGHNVMAHLLATGNFDVLLRELLGPAS